MVDSYGNLSDKELFAFLDEIENEDEDLIEGTEDAEEVAAVGDAQEIINSEESPENIELEALYGEDAWRMLQDDVPILFNKKHTLKRVLDGKKQKAEKLKQEKIRIQREAFNQQVVALDEAIGPDNLKLLVSLLVKPHTEIMDRCKAFINSRMTKILRPFVPKRLLLCNTLYPASVRQSPGFLYRTEKGADKIYTFWVEPNLPYYFTQNTEPQVIFKQGKLSFLKSIDQAIKNYYVHKEKRREKEFKYATRLLDRRIVTYFDLLKLNPFWFETLLKKLSDGEY